MGIHAGASGGRKSECMGSPGVGVTGGCGLSGVGVGNACSSEWQEDVTWWAVSSAPTTT